MSYPIKYAAMPVLVQKDWAKCLNETTKSMEFYYIATRCYLVSETLRHYENGESKMTYRVVYPLHCSMVKDKPKFGFEGQCINGFDVEKVYNEDELNILKQELEELNRKLLAKKIPKTNYNKELLQTLQDSFVEMKQEYDQMEKELEDILKEELPFETQELTLKK